MHLRATTFVKIKQEPCPVISSAQRHFTIPQHNLNAAVAEIPAKVGESWGGVGS